jgi:hypothetical protein
MISRPVRLAAVAVLAGLAPAARAQPGGAPSLAVRAPTTDCAAAPPFLAFVEALRVELASSGPPCCAIVAPDAAQAGPGLALTLTGCDPGAAGFAIEVSDPATGRVQSRPISLADVAPDARPRALALAVAELVRSIEAAATPPAPAAAAGVAPTASATGIVARASALADLRAYAGTRTVLWGGRLALSLDRGRWRGALALGAARGERQVSLGTIDVTLASAGLVFARRFVTGAWAFDVGPAGELGLGRVDGQTGQVGVTAGSGSGLTATLGAAVGAEAPAGRSLRVRVAIEAGGVLRRLTGAENGADAAGISGAYVGLDVGVGTGL